MKMKKHQAKLCVHLGTCVLVCGQKGIAIINHLTCFKCFGARPSQGRKLNLLQLRSF